MFPARHVCGEIIFLLHIETPEAIDVFYPRDDRQGIGEPIIYCPKCDEGLLVEYLGNPYLVKIMNGVAAIVTQAHMYCSNCWQNKFYTEPAYDCQTKEIGVRVLCETCREETVGYVSKVYIDIKRTADHFNYEDIVRVLSPILGLAGPAPRRKDEEKILSELGF